MIKNLKYISLMLVLSACADVGDRPESADQSADSELIADAKMFMEEYSALELDYTLEGLHPGAYSPVWNKAVTLESGGFEVINVPISSEATYEATMYTNPDEKDEEETYHTAIAQKLVIQREMSSGVWSCFMLSLIPDASCSTDNRMNVSNMFVCGSDETKFSGIVVYSTVTTNFTAQIDIYTNGKLRKSLSVYNGDFDWSRDFKQMSEMIPIKSLTRNVRAISRSGDEFGGWGSGITLPEIVVPGGGGNGGGTGGGVPSLPPPPDPPFPNYPSDPNAGKNYPPNNPPYTNPSNGGGNNGNTGNGSTDQSNVTTTYKKEAGDKLIKDNVSLKIDKQIGGTCVEFGMSYLDKIYGGKRLPGDFLKIYYQLSLDGVCASGVVPEYINSFYQKCFNVEYCSNIVQSIRDGYPVACGVRINSDTFHNLIIIGYKTDGRYIYMDSASGKCMMGPASNFINTLYKYKITGRK